jgi:hypothetical protein
MLSHTLKHVLLFSGFAYPLIYLSVFTNRLKKPARRSSLGTRPKLRRLYGASPQFHNIYPANLSKKQFNSTELTAVKFFITGS